MINIGAIMSTLTFHRIYRSSCDESLRAPQRAVAWFVVGTDGTKRPGALGGRAS
jgi:hypothetical protein